jgi:hypothetical protein
VTEVSIKIVRFIDDDQPGWVACELMDASGYTHTLVDKVPIFTIASLDANSLYPQPGFIACEVISRWQDGEGRQLVRINTAKPFGVDSDEGVTEFVVLSEQIIDTVD